MLPRVYKLHCMAICCSSGVYCLFFPKNNTNLRQNYFENFEGLREVTHIMFHLVFIWFLFGLEPGWQKVSQKKLNENMFSGHQTLRQTLEFGIRRVCHV
jgi:hypothetical protein